MNYFYSGKPRAGKSKAAVMWLIERLRFTKRAIVTNMALKMDPWVDGKGVARPGLLDVLQRKYGSTFDAKRRVYLLKDDEVRNFFRIRPVVPEHEWEAVEIRMIPESGDDRWRFDADRYPACDYIIDEAHEYFPRQGLPSYKQRPFSGEMLGYATQAGRGGDENIYISQLPNNTNLQLRGVCQECHWFVNHAHLLVGPFRKANKITYDVYCNTPPAAGEERLKRTTLHYDRWDIESCYNTAEGGGVRGNAAADIGLRAKGLPSWSIAVLIGIAILGFLGLAKAARVGAAYAVGGSAPKKAASVAPERLFSPAQTEALKRMLVEARVANVTMNTVGRSVDRKDVPEQVKARGWAKVGEKYAVFLANGETVWGRRLWTEGKVVLLDNQDFELATEEKGEWSANDRGAYDRRARK